MAVGAHPCEGGPGGGDRRFSTLCTWSGLILWRPVASAWWRSRGKRQVCSLAASTPVLEDGVATEQSTLRDIRPAR